MVRPTLASRHSSEPPELASTSSSSSRPIFPRGPSSNSMAHSNAALPPLSIRLTEPITFLRGTATGEDFRGRRQLVSADAPPAVLRGLLTLRLTKASTRIKRIEVRLEGKVRTEWPEGIGPRRTETSEEKIILSEGITFFSAASSAVAEQGPSRRALSVGPGATPSTRDDWDAFDVDEEDSDEAAPAVEEEERGRRAAPSSQVRSSSAMPLTPTTASQGSSRWREGADPREALLREDRARGPSPAYAFRDPLRRPPGVLNGDSASSSRRSFSGPSSSSSGLRDELVREYAADREDSSPSRPSLVQAVVGSSRSTTHSAQEHTPATDEEAPNAPSARSSRSDLRARVANANADYVTVTRPGSHRTSLVEQVASPAASPRLMAASPHELSSRENSLDSGHQPAASSSVPTSSPNTNAVASSSSSPPPPPPSKPPAERGRKSTSSKFSIANAFRTLSHDVAERVGSRSRSRLGATLGRPPNESVEQLALTRQETLHPPPLDPDFVRPFGRGGAGRSISRNAGEGSSRDRSESTTRGRSNGLKLLNGMESSAVREEQGSSWREFRKGVYNYPIAFSIPADSPPTIHADFGSVVYRLRATVFRAGALSPNFVDEQEVTLVASPTEEDTEETENVIVERQWEDQMSYLIALSGKAFPIGGQM